VTEEEDWRIIMEHRVTILEEQFRAGLAILKWGSGISSTLLAAILLSNFVLR